MEATGKVGIDAVDTANEADDATNMDLDTMAPANDANPEANATDVTSDTNDAITMAISNATNNPDAGAGDTGDADAMASTTREAQVHAR